jgi:hypothetical protein
MKKIYKQPEMEIVKVQTQTMLATSIGVGEPVPSAAGADAPEFNGSWDDEY